MSAWDELRQHAVMERRMLAAKSAFDETRHPFKIIPEVEAWKEQYAGANASGCSRFKFLILEGESRFGKTRFACNLFGSKFTVVINCQGVQQPYMSRYDPSFHRAIVLDEPSAELVARCKVFLQAGMDGAELFQSATQRYTRWYCVHNVPIIICTNDWSSPGLGITEELRKWIDANSKHVSVMDYLFDAAPTTFV